MPPLLSVIIPTFRRPALLGRAIDSALTALPDGLDAGEIEVVVVPNGPDDSWQTLAAQRAADTRIQWHYLARGNAAAARNHGLARSTGRYVRFLDDDDVLLPAAARQLTQLLASGASLSSGPLQITDARSGSACLLPLPVCEDYVEAALLCVGIGLAAGSVYRRDVLAEVRWPEDVSLHDDYLWSLALAQGQAVRWIQCAEPVAAYMQHGAERLSRLRRTTENTRVVIDAIWALEASLRASQRLSDRHRRAVATALLTHAHSAFLASPVMLSRVIHEARRLDGHALPRQPLFTRHRWLGRSLLLTEWTLLPLRWLTRSLQGGA